MWNLQKYLQNGTPGYILLLETNQLMIKKKFSWQKEHEENLTGTKRAHKPPGSLSSNLKKNIKKYETWKF